MKLEPLYLLEFEYPEAWRVDLGSEEQHFFVAEGRAAGFLTGRFRGANHPRRRADGTFCPDFQGVIETDDGAQVAYDLRGYGRDRDGRFAVHGSVTHSTADERYVRLNDIVCVFAAEAFDDEVVYEVAALVWEPPAT